MVIWLQLASLWQNYSWMYPGKSPEAICKTYLIFYVSKYLSYSILIKMFALHYDGRFLLAIHQNWGVMDLLQFQLC